MRDEFKRKNLEDANNRFWKCPYDGPPSTEKRLRRRETRRRMRQADLTEDVGTPDPLEPWQWLPLTPPDSPEEP